MFKLLFKLLIITFIFGNAKAEENLSEFPSANKILNKLLNGKFYNCKHLDKFHSMGKRQGRTEFPKGIGKHSEIPKDYKIIFSIYEPDKSIDLIVSKNNEFYGVTIHIHDSFGQRKYATGKLSGSSPKRTNYPWGVIFKSSEKNFALPLEANWIPTEDENYKITAGDKLPLYFDGESLRIRPMLSWFTDYYKCEELKLIKRDKKFILKSFIF